MRYLNGSMPVEEKIAFEKKLENNASLSDDLLSFIVNEYEDERLRAEIRKSGSKPMKLAPRQVLKWAALILVFLLPAGFFLQQYLSKSSSLLTGYYADYPAQSILRGNVNNDVLVSQAFLLYADDQYQEAAQLFDQVLQSDDTKGSSKLQLYAGISLLRTEKPENYPTASQHLSEVLETPNEFNQAAEWFLALSLWESGDKEEAKVLFEQIANNENHYNSVKAGEVLEEKY